MSGAFAMPHALTGGSGYKANASYDEFLRKHSGFYRRHSAASNAQEDDRRRSSAGIDQHGDAARQAVANVEASERRGSFTPAAGGAATANSRKGSVVVASDATRKDSIFGMEATAGTNMNPERRPSTSLASDLFHKMKGDHK
jgi:hypothetical protein